MVDDDHELDTVGGRAAHAAVVSGLGSSGLTSLVEALETNANANEESALLQIAHCLCRIVDRADEPTRAVIGAVERRSAACAALATLKDRRLLDMSEPGCEALFALLAGRMKDER